MVDRQWTRADFVSDEYWLKYCAILLRDQVSSSIAGEDPGGKLEHWMSLVKKIMADREKRGERTDVWPCNQSR